jgi:mannan endo-1,4-beta-mannosidase
MATAGVDAAAASAATSAAASPPGSPAPMSSPPPRGFVAARNGRFEIAGAPFRYGGTNTYYLHYESEFMVRSALQQTIQDL